MTDSSLLARVLALFSLTHLCRTKPVDHLKAESEQPEHQLRRELGPVQLTLFGIGAIIGAGIFATIGTAAAGDAQRLGAGSALMVSFVITAIVCSFTALCYAEFAAMVPISGSAYTYAYASLGELIAWIIGWDLIIEYAVGNIAVAISWGNYFKTFVRGLHIPHLAPDGIIIPDWLSMDYRTAAKADALLPNGDKIFLSSGEVAKVLDVAPHLFGMPIVINVLAVGIVMAITLVLILGIRESAWFNAGMVGVKIVVLTFFIVVGLTWIKPENWTTPSFAPNGWHGISAGAAIVFFAYIGFDAVSTVAEETRNPQRNLPIGILASLAICTFFYVVVAAIFTGLISYPELTKRLATEQAEPLTLALQHVGAADWIVGVVAFGSVIAHTAVLLVYQLGQPRIFMAMARDGLLPPMFAHVHPRFRTPYLATILTGIFVASFSAVASIDEMVDLTNIGTLFAFILVCAGIMVLRVKEPDRPRPFRVPGGTYLLPTLGIVSCLYLVYYLPPTSWLRFAAWLNCGFVIYVGYGMRHSRLTGAGVDGAEPSAHLSSTARAGLGLAVLGILMLAATHAFDLWLVGLDKHKEAGLGERLGTAAAAMVHADGWLTMPEGVLNELFWFWIVPLALNAFVLCPIVIARLRRVDRTTHQTSGALYGAAGLALAVAVYFGVVIAWNWHPWTTG